MRTAKIAVTMDRKILTRLDNLVKGKVFENQNKAVQEAVREKLQRLARNRLTRECAKLDKKAEQAMAEEGFGV
jgi:Arc/MetJ-type ribon-helix-helix transcriptional regulator